MKTYMVESTELAAKPERAFAYLADARNLPEWTHAFRSVGGGRALMETPAGAVEVELQTIASADAGTVDWRMVFPDGNVALAYSRVTPGVSGGSIYTFVLNAPPAPLEELEGALEAQAAILRTELKRLAEILK